MVSITITAAQADATIINRLWINLEVDILFFIL